MAPSCLIWVETNKKQANKQPRRPVHRVTKICDSIWKEQRDLKDGSREAMVCYSTSNSNQLMRCSRESSRFKKGKMTVSWWLSRLEKGRGMGIRQWMLMGNDYNFFKERIILWRRRFATCVCVFVYEDASVLLFYFETGYPFLLDASDQLVFCILWASRPASSWGIPRFLSSILSQEGWGYRQGEW